MKDVSSRKLLPLALTASCALTSSPLLAMPVVNTINVDLSTLGAEGYTISLPGSLFAGSSVKVTGTGSFPSYISVETLGEAAVRTVFGSPSTDFPGRGTVIYDGSTLGGYGTFASLTAVYPSNGDNFLGLRFTGGGQDYYGFLYTTDTMLNSVGYETVAGAGINPETALAAQVPESATWAMLVGGFGLVGAGLRRRKVAVTFA